MDVVTLGAALNGSAEYVNSHFVGGSNIQIVDNPDGTQTINASGEVSAEDTVARAEIAEIKDGETLDSFGDVETALGDKADSDNVYKLALSNADLLPANTDLDNVKTVGCYYVYESAKVTTIANRPTNNTSAFRLTVEFAAGEKRARQIYQEFNSFDKYIRWENSSNVFSTWKKVECDLSTKQDTISDLATIRSGAALGATAVQPVTGKGLSTNDYTDTDKSKLADIAAGAEVNEIEGIKVNNSTVNPDVNKVVNITVPTTAADVSALPDTTKYAAALSLTINSSTFVMTGQLKDQNGDNLGTAQTIDLPLESVVVGGSYNSQTKKVVLTLQNGNTIEFSVADLVSGLQTELSTSNKLNPAYINYDSTHRAVSDTEKSTWNGKQNALTAAQLAAVNSGIDSAKVEQIETNENNISLLESMNGAKNDFYFGNVTDSTGMTHTINGNAITIDGVQTCGYVSIEFIPSTNGAYMISLNISDLSTNNGHILVYDLTTSTKIGELAITSTGTKTIQINISDITHTHALRLYTNYSSSSMENASMTADDIMVYRKSIYDAGFNEFIPYAMSNAELTVAEKQNENNIVFVSQNGAANYVKVGTNSYVNNGITVTVSNGEITISGTANGTFSLYIGGKITDDIENDNKLTSKLPDVIAFTGVPNTDNKNRMIFALYNGSTWVYSGSTNDLYHDLTGKVYTHWLLYIPIVSGNQYNGVWKPMIVPKSLYDSGFTAYQPYAMSNAELTAAEKQNEADILSEQAKTTGMTEGGSNYITVGGIRVYVSATAPTGDIPDGSIWIGG